MDKDSQDESVRVICSELSKNYLGTFEKFIRTNLGLSIRQIHESKNSNRTPLVALCVQHDDIQTDIKALEKVIAGSQATLVIIIECAQNVPLMTTQLSFNESLFPNLVRLRYSTSDGELYNCEEPKSSVELLQIIWSEYNLQVFRSTNSSTTPSNGKEISKTPHNPEPQMNLQSHSYQGYVRANSRDITILCNRRSELCKSIFMNIKRQYSIRIEFPWISNVEEAHEATKLILVCLKISRLTDDIADAIKMAGLSANQTIFLVIIHTIEPGVDADISVPIQDNRILDVASILYSENVGCYDCPENRTAISKITSWFT